MFHSLPCPCARLGATLLSRFRARALPCLFCKTGFAASMPEGAFRGGRRRHCAVNVKLTMRLEIAAGLLMSAISDARRFLQGSAKLLCRRRQTGLVVARGGGGMSPGFLVREDQHGRGRASQALPAIQISSRNHCDSSTFYICSQNVFHFSPPV